MLAAAFFVTVVVALAAHHVLIERPRRATLRAVEQRTRPGPARLEDITGAVPGGVFLQNGFTWSRVTPEGAVEVGVHPMLVGLVGRDPQFELEQPGARVERGRPFLRVRHGDRHLAIRAPLSGRVTARNRWPRRDGSWEGAAGRDGSWLYRIEPDDLAREVPTWMIGERAQLWTRNRCARIREHLQHAVAEGEVGLAFADGGEVPFGALAELGPDAWQAFETAFLKT